MTTEPTPPAAPAGRDTEIRERAVGLALAALRVVMIVGVASLLLASATLLLYGAVGTARQVVRLVTPGLEAMTNRDMFLASIKLVDLILLATIMQVVGIGLYSLFVDKNIPVPAWLRTTDVDELKYKLAGIVVVMLGVLFLEQVFSSEGERDILPLGIGTAAVIFALSYFITARPPRT